MTAPADIDEVRHALAVDDRTEADASRWPWELDADRLRATHGDRAFELVATFLTDDEVGYAAAQTLLVLDHDRGLATILGAAEHADRNVRNVGLREILAAPAAAAGPWREPALEAALHVLADVGANADSVVEALKVAGLTGTAVHVPLLVPFLDPSETNPHWHDKIRHAALGALGRLRYAPATETIRAGLVTALSKPSPTVEELWTASAWAADAQFALDPALGPELCALITYPTVPPERTGCTYPPPPGQQAAVAILTLAGTPPSDLRGLLVPDVGAAAAWCAGR